MSKIKVRTVGFNFLVGIFFFAGLLYGEIPFSEAPVKSTSSTSQATGVNVPEAPPTSSENQPSVTYPDPPKPISLDKPVGQEISMASPKAQAWFDEAMKIAEDWDFPENVVNKYGKTITDADFLKALIWIESNGIHKSPHGRITKSYVGALGFGQLMPRTAKGIRVNPNDPAENLKGMAKYIRELFDAPNIENSVGVEKLLKAAAGYNMGAYATVLKRDWEQIKQKAPRETAGYGIKLKMCLGFELTDWEKKTAAKLLGASMKTIDAAIDDYYARTQGLLLK